MVIDVLRKGGEDGLTAFHEASEANNLEIMKTMCEIVTNRQDVFPSMDSILFSTTKKDQSVLDLATSDEMKSLLNGFMDGAGFYLDEVSKCSLFIVLRKYCSVFSLHFVREDIKKKSGIKYSSGNNCLDGRNIYQFDYKRKDETKATDIRTFNHLRKFSGKFVSPIFQIIR